MKIKKLGLLACAGMIVAASCEKANNTKTPVDYVNPYMGNISHLLVPTYPTVHLPNSMLRVYPERADFTSDQLQGLPVVVTSHRGSSAFNLSPTQAEDGKLRPVINYSYDLEHIKPYSYSVYLDDDEIGVEFAPSHQAGIYEFEFNKGDEAKLIVNTRNGHIQATNNGVEGYQIIDNTPTKIYLYMEAQQPVVSKGLLVDGKVDTNIQEADGRNQAIVLNFGKDVDKLNIRYGISLISTEQAKKNLNREISNYDVKALAQAGRNLWNETLGKIEVEGGSEDDKVVFYTSLYRTYERMVHISEDGKYYSAAISGEEGKIIDDEGTPFYIDDWIWDTYRATHPLRVIIEPEMELNMIKSYIRMAQENREGWMPTFPEITGDSHRMNGNHAVAVIADAYAKGLTDFDVEAAFNASKGALTEKSLLPWVRIPSTRLDKFYYEKGYFPAVFEETKDPEPEVHSFEQRQAISVTLGTSYDDWCLAQIAKALGKEDDYKHFMKRSLNYRNVFNPETSFFHPKYENGEFITPIDYSFSGGQGGRYYYGENNAWIYRWDVQHNFADLIKLMGGEDQFIANLDKMFQTPLGRSKFAFYSKFPDHTGNVGQYSMANEPSLHIPYLYNYAGQPWKTQKRIRELLNQWFRNDVMGVPGDEDGGGMSAFVAFSQMGFYPVTPGMPAYNIGSPVFDKTTINLPNGKKFVIEAKNNSFDNKYIQSATLNGVKWDKPWFTHDDIKDGGSLVLVMGPKANKEWGSDLKNVPPSAEVVE